MPGIEDFYVPANDNYWCGDCSRFFANYHAITSHLLNSSNHCWCARCERDFNSEHAIAAHCRDSRLHWQCESEDDDDDDYCDFDGFSFQDLCDHWDEEGCYEYCCDLGWLDDEELRQHQREVHGHNCDYCDRTFLDAQALRQHSEAKHPQPKLKVKAPSAAARYTQPVIQAPNVPTSTANLRTRSVTQTPSSPSKKSSPTKQSTQSPAMSSTPHPTLKMSTARAVASPEDRHSTMAKENRLTSRRLDAFSDAANDIAANMHNTKSLLQKSSPARSFAATALMRDGVLSKAKAPPKDDHLRVSRLRPANDGSGAPREPTTTATPSATRPLNSTLAAPLNLDDSTASMASYLARRAGTNQGDASTAQPSAATVQPANPTPTNPVQKASAEARGTTHSQRLISVDIPLATDPIEKAQQNISRAISQTRSPSTTVNTADALPSTKPASTVTCATACSKRFNLISELVTHIEAGECSALAVVDLYQAAVGCTNSHLFIWGRYHVDMDERRDLKDKYLTNAWPFICPKAPCEEVFQTLKELYEHVEGGKCIAGQALGEGAMGDLTDALRYRCSQGLI